MRSSKTEPPALSSDATATTAFVLLLVALFALYGLPHRLGVQVEDGPTLAFGSDPDTVTNCAFSRAGPVLLEYCR